MYPQYDRKNHSFKKYAPFSNKQLNKIKHPGPHYSYTHIYIYIYIYTMYNIYNKQNEEKN